MPVILPSVEAEAGTDALDLITLTEAKAALNVTTSGQDTELARVVTAVSRRIDDLCGPVVIRSVTDLIADGGTTHIFLDHYPVAAITSVTEYSDTTATVLTVETNASKPTSGYLLDAEMGMIRRRSGGSDTLFPTGRGNVVVVYTAGRYASTAAVDPKFKHAAELYLRHLWTPNQGMAPASTAIPTFGVPNVVMDLLADERKAPVIA